jgi:hypothetical protein
MVTQAGKKTVSQKSMLDEPKTAHDLAQPVALNWISFNHFPSPLYFRPSILRCHSLCGQIHPQFAHKLNKNGSIPSLFFQKYGSETKTTSLYTMQPAPS